LNESLQIIEDRNKEFQIKGATEVLICNKEEAMN